LALSVSAFNWTPCKSFCGVSQKSSCGSSTDHHKLLINSANNFNTSTIPEQFAETVNVRTTEPPDDAPPWTRMSFILSKRHLQYLESVNQADVKPSFLSTLHRQNNIWKNIESASIFDKVCGIMSSQFYFHMISYFHNHKTMPGYIFIIGFKVVPRVKDWWPKAESVLILILMLGSILSQKTIYTSLC